jgi:signal transduction histidine kinase
MIHALREVLINALDHGAAFNAEQVVEVTGIRTARALVFHVRDPGPGFRPEEQNGTGYSRLLSSGTVNELIYSDIGNEVLLIKYFA